MSFDIQSEATRRAHKQHICHATETIKRREISPEEVSPDDWSVIQQAKNHHGRIEKGASYVQVSGSAHGVLTLFKARPELHEICKKYHLYGG